MVTSLANISTMEKLVVKIILGVKVLFVNRFSFFFVAIFTTFGKQNDDKSTIFSQILE